MSICDEFILLESGSAADLYIDKGDWEGAALALTALQDDIERVGGRKPAMVNEASRLSGMAVLTGTIGRSAVIDRLIREGKIDVSKVRGQWESYLLAVADAPLDGVDRALVVAGSDKRGTIYGIYKISEMIGVSPWVWWADSVPARQSRLAFPGDLLLEQGEPSAKYRGIFLNDEAPSLSGWVSAKFGKTQNEEGTAGYTHEFYQKVFELLLRLKGNYLWPTMWNSAFHTDDALHSAMADAYGIVMGTSHQEHMTCADKEWSWSNLGAWNYFTNRDNIYRFWKNGVTERREYESILTLGMRGQADTAILGPGATLKDNMDLIAGVLADQREIIADVYGNAGAPPQLLALYKEVEDFYYGSAEYGKLDVPDDVTLMLCDDNHGNLRTLPAEETRKRSGGFGLYYHFDYRGGPISYQWINQTPLAKVWEQMTTAYDAGVDRVWIVNVGDLKPMELPIDYFLNLAYDYGQWSPANKTAEFTRAFAAREFGEDAADDGAAVLNGYTRILGARKAEVVMPDPSTFSLTAFDEADRVLAEFEAVVHTAEAVYDRLPAPKRDTFYQLALYPARAAMNVYKCNIYAAWSLWLAERGLPAANEYAALARAAFSADAADMEYYNKQLAGGKWDGIMRQNHIGYTAWDGPSTSAVPSRMPKTGQVTPASGSELAVRPQYSGAILRSGTASLPAFTHAG
ncbi:MAG: glycosyl hydrolase 115 family protein, partial [Oscillospiraceae bacterium]|nr:glycosyl hydrolase 115 family protein [Oscillospiraceae bacterium]